MNETIAATTLRALLWICGIFFTCLGPRAVAGEGLSMTVPDLQDGFMIINHEGVIAKKPDFNRWWTGVQCVLVKKTSGSSQDRRAYLCHECRSELVGADPFGHRGNYEWAGISTWLGNFALRSGPGHAHQPNMVYEKMPDDMTILVSCRNRKARPVSFQAVTKLLQSDFKSGYVTLYMAIAYRENGEDYVLYAPCNYINFPHPEMAAPVYLQPISGYVLYETGGRFYVSYVVIYIENGAIRALQFKLRDEIVYGDVVTHDFYKTVRIGDRHATCEFFAYDSR